MSILVFALLMSVVTVVYLVDDGVLRFLISRARELPHLDKH